MTILALDIGKKRVGMAVENQGIAFPLKVIIRANLVKELTRLIKEREIKTIVVGMPYGEYSGGNDAIETVRKTLLMLQKTFPSIHFETEDERFSTSIAASILEEVGVDQDRKDDIAATIILESFLKRG